MTVIQMIIMGILEMMRVVIRTFLCFWEIKLFCVSFSAQIDFYMVEESRISWTLLLYYLFLATIHLFFSYYYSLKALCLRHMFWWIARGYNSFWLKPSNAGVHIILLACFSNEDQTFFFLTHLKMEKKMYLISTQNGKCSYSMTDLKKKSFDFI